MRATTAVTLMLASSMSIFGLHSCHGNNEAYASVEPVWVNGVMGVYYPGTLIFVPHTSPAFDQACNLIQQNRDQQYGIGSSYWWSGGYNHHWFYYPGNHVFAYSQGGASAASSWSSSAGSSGSSFWGGSSSHFGSARGGIGGFGEGHGGGHGGGE